MPDDLPTRINLVLSERQAQMIVDLREKTDATTNSEVLREALRLYKWIIDLEKVGMEIAAVRNGKPVKFFKLL